MTTIVLHQLFLLVSLIVMVYGMHAAFGQTTVLVFMGFGVLAAAAAATGDSNPALEKEAPRNTMKKGK